MQAINRNLAITVAVVVILVGLASPASAGSTVRALWDMNSLPALVDSAGGDNNGKTSNITMSGGLYSFNGKSSYATASDKANLDPGDANVTLTARVSFTAVPKDSQTFDIVRKGDKYTSGGYYKMEIIRSSTGKAVATCRYKDGDGGGAADVYGTVHLAGKGLVTISCSKNASGISLSAGGATSTTVKRLGSIQNSAPIFIGGKGDGTDWFPGLMDFVKIEIG